MSPRTLFSPLFLCLAALLAASPCLTTSGSGRWELLQRNIGISAMHMQLLHNDRVVMFDRTDFGQSNISLPNGKCRVDPHDQALTTDCTAHSVEYDVSNNTIRPLMVLTDTWCSSGSVNPNGTLVQTGGDNDGDHVVREYTPCDTCDWVENPYALTARRWYATNLKLPDGRQIIIGGSRQPNYEFYPRNTPNKVVYDLPFLVETNDAGSANNLYPFVFLNVDGNLFIFANNRAILLDYTNNKVVKTFPKIPGGDPRNYPSTGSAVLLPLLPNSNSVEAQVLVCGGAPKWSYENTRIELFAEAISTCARIKITDPSPQWEMEAMPIPRVMGDMVLLPTGDILIINGASAGTAGWDLGRNATLNPVIYRTQNSESKFEVKAPTTIPRMYHSCAVLLRDGRVLVGGSNPHKFYRFVNVMYPTELSLEAFWPDYLGPEYVYLRPKIVSEDSVSAVAYGQNFTVQFTLATMLEGTMLSVTFLAPPFNTHSFSMNQRLLVLVPEGGGGVTQNSEGVFEITVTMPSNPIIAPPGYYMLFVVHRGVPSVGTWINIR